MVNMELHSVLVTGANRGIGLEFVRQLTNQTKPPQFLFATYRSSEGLDALTKIKNSCSGCQVELLKMDVTKHEDIVAVRRVVEQKVGEKGLTLLINNAGIAEPLGFPNVTEENLLKHFTVNTVGPTMVFQEMLPSLQKAAAANKAIDGMSATRAAVLNLTSMVGSITKTGVEFIEDIVAIGYKTSKAGLNMAMRAIAAKVKEENILVVMMCPGYVKTDMNTTHGQITPEESISVMLKTLQTLNKTHHGTFMDRLGNLYPF